MTRSVHDHFGPWPHWSMTSSVFPICVKRTIEPPCQIAMFLIDVKCQQMSISLPIPTPIRAYHTSESDTLESIDLSKVQISGGWLQLTLNILYHSYSYQTWNKAQAEILVHPPKSRQRYNGNFVFVLIYFESMTYTGDSCLHFRGGSPSSLQSESLASESPLLLAADGVLLLRFDTPSPSLAT